MAGSEFCDICRSELKECCDRANSSAKAAHKRLDEMERSKVGKWVLVLIVGIMMTVPTVAFTYMMDEFKTMKYRVESAERQQIKNTTILEEIRRVVK